MTHNSYQLFNNLSIFKLKELVQGVTAISPLSARPIMTPQQVPFPKHQGIALMSLLNLIPEQKLSSKLLIIFHAIIIIVEEQELELGKHCSYACLHHLWLPVDRSSNLLECHATSQFCNLPSRLIAPFKFQDLMAFLGPSSHKYSFFSRLYQGLYVFFFWFVYYALYFLFKHNLWPFFLGSGMSI